MVKARLSGSYNGTSIVKRIDLVPDAWWQIPMTAVASAYLNHSLEEPGRGNMAGGGWVQVKLPAGTQQPPLKDIPLCCIKSCVKNCWKPVGPGSDCLCSSPHGWGTCMGLILFSTTWGISAASGLSEPHPGCVCGEVFHYCLLDGDFTRFLSSMDVSVWVRQLSSVFIRIVAVIRCWILGQVCKSSALEPASLDRQSTAKNVLSRWTEQICHNVFLRIALTFKDGQDLVSLPRAERLLKL